MSERKQSSTAVRWRKLLFVDVVHVVVAGATLVRFAFNACLHLCNELRDADIGNGCNLQRVWPIAGSNMSRDSSWTTRCYQPVGLLSDSMAKALPSTSLSKANK